MKMLTDEQIKLYMKRIKGKNKKRKLKAKSILGQDIKRYGQIRIDMCRKKIETLFGKSN